MKTDSRRIRALNGDAPRKGGRYVLYWAQMNRRAAFNHALAYAVEIANANGLPLLVVECLTIPANDRLYTFILEAVPETARAVRALGAGYLFYLRRGGPDAVEFIRLAAAKAHTLVTDDYPVFAAAAHNRKVPAQIGVPYLAVDSSCIVPMNVHEKREYGAYTIRPKIKRELPNWLKPFEMPRLKQRWQEELLPKKLAALRTDVTADHVATLAAECDIDHSVRPSVEYRGGAKAAQKRLKAFLEDRLFRYSKEGSQPSKHANSNLSPYLHFGQISALEVALAARDYAEEHKLFADEFLEQLIVRRELAFNFARFAGPQVESLDLLPDWCKKTMKKHARDKRPYVYTPDQFERAETHDDFWNAAQRELLVRGTIHGYYRMYWGKKIIEWSPTYEDALRSMIRLHDVYALDGRDPNTYTNILWCFGLHDRPWGERPVFGQLRYMSYDGMKRKTDVAAYIKEIAALG